jgi:hypothetical protein
MTNVQTQLFAKKNQFPNLSNMVVITILFVYKCFNLAKHIVSRVKELRLSKDDFEVLKVIGRGSFGEVAVVRLQDTDKVI